MAKFYGAIGYVENVETKPGVFKAKATERNYSGDLLRNTRDLQSKSMTISRSPMRFILWPMPMLTITSMPSDTQNFGV